MNPAYASTLGLALLCGRFVGGDRVPSRLAPAERLCALDARLPRTVRHTGQLCGGGAESIRVAVGDQLARAIDHLGQARVAVSGHRTAARQRLEARQAEAFIAAREDEAAGRRVDVG